MYESSKATLSEVHGLLREALARLDMEEPETACWRLADAGGLLRQVLEHEDYTELSGFDRRTGRGFVLPAPAFPGREIP